MATKKSQKELVPKDHIENIIKYSQEQVKILEQPGMIIDYELPGTRKKSVTPKKSKTKSTKSAKSKSPYRQHTPTHDYNTQISPQ